MARKTKKAGVTLHVFLVDAQPSVRKGVEMLLSREPDITVCGETGSAAEAMIQVTALNPDVAILDLTLEQGDGLKLMGDLRACGLKLKFLVFSMHNQAAYIATAIQAGADGYVTKEEGTDRLVEAVRAVARGEFFLTDATLSRLGWTAPPGRAIGRPPSAR